jgi:tRNA A37 threonylcarbamoyladenosine synthetase subunit TsaC/SUA5/YrdC
MPQVAEAGQLDTCEVDSVSVVIAAGDLVRGNGSTVVDCTGPTLTILREGALDKRDLNKLISAQGFGE